MAEPKVFRLRIELQCSDPPIWRQVDVSAAATLGELHEIIQIAMGWEDYHLHQFTLKDKNAKPTPEDQAAELQGRAGGGIGFADPEALLRMRGERRFVPVDPDFDDLELPGEGEDAVTVAEVLPRAHCKIEYLYDFGDGWMHDVRRERTVKPDEAADHPVCRAGARACPPEDCGGVWGYYDLIQALDDPQNERQHELLEWCGGSFDAEAFDVDEVNKRLARWARGENPYAADDA